MTGQHYSGQLKRQREAVKEKMLPWQQFTIADLNLYPIHLIRQTRPFPTFLSFSASEKALAGRHFASDDDVMAAVKEFLESKTKKFFYSKTKAL